MAQSSTINYDQLALCCLIELPIQSSMLETSAILSICSIIAFRIEEGDEDIKRFPPSDFSGLANQCFEIDS